MNTAATAFSAEAAPAPASAAAAPAAAPAPSPAATPSAAPATAAAPGADSWYSGFENPDVRNWTQAKGFKDPAQLAESAWNLEKLLGHDRAGRTVVIPGDDAPADEVAAFRTKMGVPEKADDYMSVIKVPEGQPDTFAKEAAAWFHEAGVPPKMAGQLAEKWNAYVASAMQGETEQMAQRADKEFGEVVAGWGKDADANLELGKRAASQFIPAKDAKERQEILGKIERAVGTRTMLEMFANIGQRVGEHKVHSNGDSAGMGMSAAEAKTKIEALKADKAWTQAYLNGDANKKAEMERLTKLAFPISRDGA